MKNLNRRDLCVALSAFAALGGVATVEGQGLNGVVPSSDKVLSESEVFPFDKLAVHQNANGGQTRNVVTGVLATGEAVEIHETTLPPGKMPHPPHKHQHSEFMMVREGMLEFDNDGKLERVGPGGRDVCGFECDAWSEECWECAGELLRDRDWAAECSGERLVRLVWFSADRC